MIEIAIILIALSHLLVAHDLEKKIERLKDDNMRLETYINRLFKKELNRRNK